MNSYINFVPKKNLHLPIIINGNISNETYTLLKNNKYILKVNVVNNNLKILQDILGKTYINCFISPDKSITINDIYVNHRFLDDSEFKEDVKLFEEIEKGYIWKVNNVKTEFEHKQIKNELKQIKTEFSIIVMDNLNAYIDNKFKYNYNLKAEDNYKNLLKELSLNLNL